MREFKHPDPPHSKRTVAARDRFSPICTLVIGLGAICAALLGSSSTAFAQTSGLEPGATPAFQAGTAKAVPDFRDARGGRAAKLAREGARGGGLQTAATSAGRASSPIYWGAWIAGSVSGHGDAPWDMRSVSAFERQAGKGVSIIHFGQPWYTSGVPQPFYPQPLEAVREHGAIPLVDWGSWDNHGAKYQPAFSLGRIIDGSFDWYIRRWATGARDWGHPFFLRFDHEMNGDWFTWSEGVDGNTPGQFVAAWRHVHRVFDSVGVSNVTWVWSPIIEYSEHTPLAEMYPGEAYVDWMAMDGYNFGTNPVSGDRWTSFASVFGPTYAALLRLAPSKPIMIAEAGSSEYGGSKAAWLKHALSVELPTAFPRIKAFVWFNSRNDGDWPISTSVSARTAFAAGIASPYFTGNDFSTEDSSPIKPA